MLLRDLHYLAPTQHCPGFKMRTARAILGTIGERQCIFWGWNNSWHMPHTIFPILWSDISNKIDTDSYVNTRGWMSIMVGDFFPRCVRVGGTMVNDAQQTAELLADSQRDSEIGPRCSSLSGTVSFGHSPSVLWVCLTGVEWEKADPSHPAF